MKITKRFKIIFAVAFTGCLAISNLALAGTANLSWDANTESDLAGYEIYYGTNPRSGNCPPDGYSGKVDVGKVTSYTINNLTDGATYYFSVTAYDNSGNESGCSSEVSKSTTSLSADFNGDTKVNSVDLGIMLSNWGSTAKPQSDINQDGAVNSVDLGILLSQWTN